MPERDDEFYVGYLETSPPGIASRTRKSVVAIVLLGMVLGVLLVLAQSPFAEGVFEFGVEREFRGILVERPHPMLLVPGEAGGEPVTHYLVAYGKRGAGPLAEGLDGQPVQVSGSLIYDDRQRMIEAHAIDRIENADRRLEQVRSADELRLDRMTLVGEIVDMKCHLGVMKPGRGKPHKSCAIRCISGGIPPVLRVMDEAGRAEYLLLLSAEGGSVNKEVLDLVAEPVEITGDVARRGDLLVLYADPATYRAL